MSKSCFGKRNVCKQPCCTERRLRQELENLNRISSDENNGREKCSCGAVRRDKNGILSRLCRRKKKIQPVINRESSHEESEGVVNGLGSGSSTAHHQYLPHMPVAKSAQQYNMTHPERGKAVIFNFDTWHNSPNIQSLGLKPREGSRKDKHDLKNCLRGRDFEVEAYDNLTSQEFWKKLHELRRDDHRLRDCLMIVIMTHGEKNHIYVSDGTLIPVNLVWEEFEADRCPTLAGKPKIFVIQACRGKNYDHGTRLMDTHGALPPIQQNDVTDFASFSYVIPNAADIFVAFSCPLGQYSWRNPQNGSWFIQAICKVFSQHFYNQDLQELFTTVAREVALYNESSTKDPSSNKKRQVPSISNTLIRKVTFSPKASVQVDVNNGVRIQSPEYADLDENRINSDGSMTESSAL